MCSTKRIEEPSSRTRGEKIRRPKRTHVVTRSETNNPVKRHRDFRSIISTFCANHHLSLKSKFIDSARQNIDGDRNSGYPEARFRSQPSFRADNTLRYSASMGNVRCAREQRIIIRTTIQKRHRETSRRTMMRKRRRRRRDGLSRSNGSRFFSRRHFFQLAPRAGAQEN